MKQFNGFPAKMEFTPLPNLFFSALLPEISDIAELKTTLYIMAVLYRKREYPRLVTFRELAGDAGLMGSLRGGAKSSEEILREALKMVAARGTVIHLTLDKDGVAEDVYLLNNEANRKTVVKIQSGVIRLSGLKTGGQTYIEAEEQPDIFALYEQNIGMLTPMIAEELREAEKLYPENWIREAIRAAVNQNIRKKSYILAILERWATEGKGDGTYKRDSKTDPDKYIKGRYGHMVQR